MSLLQGEFGRSDILEIGEFREQFTLFQSLVDFH